MRESENYENIYYEGTGHMGLCDLSLASPVLSGLLDQVKSKVEPEEMLKRLNTDCLDLLQRRADESSFGARASRQIRRWRA